MNTIKSSAESVEVIWRGQTGHGDFQRSKGKSQLLEAVMKMKMKIKETGAVSWEWKRKAVSLHSPRSYIIGPWVPLSESHSPLLLLSAFACPFSYLSTFYLSFPLRDLHLNCSSVVLA